MVSKQKQDEKYVVIRFTDKEKIDKFYKMLRKQGLTDNLDTVTGDEQKAEEKKNGGSDKVTESQWSDWGANQYDENQSEGVNDFRVVQR